MIDQAARAAAGAQVFQRGGKAKSKPGQLSEKLGL
jgi:hypothetical protein